MIPPTAYQHESHQLDRELLELIDRWHRTGQPLSDAAFDDLALRIFAYQLRYNRPYAAYCAQFGVSLERLPESWHAIPAVPSTAFKDAALATFDPAHAALTFETSGTTSGTGGRHYLETAALYDAALMATFDRYVLPEGERLRYLNLVPNPHERPHSSLGYMMGHIARHRGTADTAWYVQGEALNLEAFFSDLQAAVEHHAPVCIATTAFALVHALEAFERYNAFFPLPTGSRIMETGGFKGRARVVDRSELYARTCERLGTTRDRIVSEYGMTELTSQYYDDVIVRARGDADTEPRYKLAPPWLRARVVGPDNKTLPNGTVGALVHVDLANRSSCVAIQTEDLGVAFDEGLVLIGREAGASLRGCSLSAEDLALK